MLINAQYLLVLGITVRARIKPLFLQKACIIPLSGFFALLFWFFIM